MMLTRMRVGTTGMLIVFALAWGTMAGAQPGTPETPKNQPVEAAKAPDNQGEPIHIVADRLEVDNKIRQAHFVGKVRAQQGDLTLHADKLIVAYGSEKTQQQPGASKTEQFLSSSMEGERIEQITATGHVRMIQGNRTAEGEQAVFFNVERKVVLTGKPVIRQGRDSISGERVTVFLDKDLSVVEGKGESRVQAVIYPEKGRTGLGGERQ